MTGCMGCQVLLERPVHHKFLVRMLSLYIDIQMWILVALAGFEH